MEEISGGRVFLRILSNLTDRAMVRARCVIPVDLLGSGEFSGEQVRDGIVLAAEFAAMDPYRATTHNKGIMNGIDAVAIATGNDWRAIEAAAHAYAAVSGTYSPLTRWFADAEGNLVGEIELPAEGRHRRRPGGIEPRRAHRVFDPRHQHGRRAGEGDGRRRAGAELRARSRRSPPRASSPATCGCTPAASPSRPGHQERTSTRW